MKPRKPTETDAQYIARLETAYAAKEAANKSYKKFWKKVGIVAGALQQVSLVVEGAAEITGTKDDRDVKHAIETLQTMSGFMWDDVSETIKFPDLKPWPKPDREKFGGDIDMILNSAVEKVKQSRPPWESWEDVMPAFRGKDPKDLDWIGLANEVSHAIMDLEMARGLLRLDLRSTMYDHCFERIQGAITHAEMRVRESEPERFCDDRPF